MSSECPTVISMQGPRRQTGCLAFFSGPLLALVLLSSGSLGLLLGYGAVILKSDSTSSVMGNALSGRSLMSEPVSHREPLSWRSAPMSMSNAFEIWKSPTGDPAINRGD